MGASFSRVVDTFAMHVGTCLQQQLPGANACRPSGLFSKKLEAAKEKYSAFNRELFTCYKGIRHFRFTLEGQRFTIFADYKPLTYALSCVSDPWMARQYRQLAYVAEFTSDISHIAGLENILGTHCHSLQAMLWFPRDQA
jgi:hypothetical protein